MQAQLVNADTIHIDATLIRADVSWDSLVEQHINCLEAANNAENTPSQRQKRVSLTDPERRRGKCFPIHK